MGNAQVTAKVHGASEENPGAHLPDLSTTHIPATEVSLISFKQETIDKNHDGKLDPAEFRSGYGSEVQELIKLPGSNDGTLVGIDEAFVHLDKNNDGFLSHAEFRDGYGSTLENEENEESFPAIRTFRRMSTIAAITSAATTSDTSVPVPAAPAEAEDTAKPFALPKMSSAFNLKKQVVQFDTSTHARCTDRDNAEHIDSCETDLWSWSEKYRDTAQLEAEGIADRFTTPHLVWTAEGFELDIHACQPEIFAFGIVLNAPVEGESLADVVRARIEVYSAADELLTACPFDLKFIGKGSTEFAVAMIHRADIDPKDIGPFNPSTGDAAGNSSSNSAIYDDTFLRTTLQEYLNHHFANVDHNTPLARVGLAEFNRLKRQVTAPLPATGCHTQWHFNAVGQKIPQSIRLNTEQRSFVHAHDVLSMHMERTDALANIPKWGRTKSGVSCKPRTKSAKTSRGSQFDRPESDKSASGDRPGSARGVVFGKNKPKSGRAQSARARTEGHDRIDLTSRQKAVLLNAMIDPFANITDNRASGISVRPIYNPFEMLSGDSLPIPWDYSTSDLRIGLGWETMDGSDADLDVVLVAYAGDKVFDQIDFGNSTCDGIVHHGDNRTGDGSGDDESITINLGDMDDSITQLFFFVTMFDGGEFKDLQSVSMRIMAKCKTDCGHKVSSEKEVCRFDTTGIKNLNADTQSILVGHTSLGVDGWTYCAALDGAPGMGETDFRKLLKPYIKASPVLLSKMKWKGMKAKRLVREQEERDDLERQRLGIDDPTLMPAPSPPPSEKDKLYKKATATAPELKVSNDANDEGEKVEGVGDGDDAPRKMQPGFNQSRPLTREDPLPPADGMFSL